MGEHAWVARNYFHNVHIDTLAAGTKFVHRFSFVAYSLDLSLSLFLFFFLVHQHWRSFSMFNQWQVLFISFWLFIGAFVRPVCTLVLFSI